MTNFLVLFVANLLATLALASVIYYVYDYEFVKAFIGVFLVRGLLVGSIADGINLSNNLTKNK